MQYLFRVEYGNIGNINTQIPSHNLFAEIRDAKYSIIRNKHVCRLHVFGKFLQNKYTCRLQDSAKVSLKLREY